MKAKSREAHKLAVPSLTENMGLGAKIPAAHATEPKLVRQNAGNGAGKHPSAKPITTKHKGEGWDGPKPRVALPKKYTPKGKK